ncbi:hypothetical protein FOXB_10970, partial [Fusarium oxysporum f. sp. conglutinans Fo5176]
MLPAVVPRSRIMLYNYDSRWHADAPKTRLQLCGEDLVRNIQAFRRDTAGRPIIFVGHSLGGNGLLHANFENDFKDVASSTVGVVFLGSPLRGTKLQFLPRLLTAMMQPAGSHDGITKELAYDDPGLRDKLQGFCRMLNTLSIPTSCFFELYESDYGQRGLVSGVIKGMVVEEASACIPGYNRIPLQADHFKINKFSGPNDRSFLSVSEEIRRMCADAFDIVQRRMQPNPIITDRDCGFSDILKHRPEARDCLRALFLSDPFEDMQEMKRKKGRRATGTCDWILGTEALTTWLDNKHDATSSSPPSEILWLYGNPGTGKSTMSIFLAEELSQIFSATAQKTLAYFFCDSGYDTRKTATAVVRGLLLQLLQQHPSLLDHVLPKFEEREAKAFDSFDALWAMFMNAAADKATGRKYCIIDALDECERESQEVILDQLQEAFGSSKSSNYELNICILITSRPYPEIRESLGEFTSKDLSSFEESKRDIDKFIDEKVAHLKNKKKYTTKVADQVVQILREKSESIFLWVGLACEELSSKRVVSKDAVKCLLAMPRGLHSLYKSLLDTALESDGDGGATTKRLLSFVAVAQRPLSILELAAACELYQDEDKEEREQFTTETIESCRLMVVVQDGMVLLLHQSVKDFLFSPIGSSDDHFMDELGAHAHFATRCVAYLIRHFHPGSERQGAWDGLLSYATWFWPDHARMAESQFRIEDAQAEFFVIESQSREAWLRHLRSVPVISGYKNTRATFTWTVGDRGNHIIIPERFSVFHVAAQWGIPYMVDYALLSRPNDDTSAQRPGFVDAMFINDDGMTPLEGAAKTGYIAVARRMLGRAEPGMRVSKRVVLAAAESWDNGDEVMALLLDQRGDEITITEAVLRAAANNHSKVMALLLDRRGYEITITEAVLRAAAYNYSNGAKMMALLLDRRGYEITITEEVLKAAAGNEDGGKEVIALLLDRRGDEITITEAVVKAAANNYANGNEVMALLLDWRGDDFPITVTENDGWTLSHWASVNGHINVIKLLIQHGCDITVTTEDGATPLHLASANGHIYVVHLLIDEGASATAVDEHGRAPLHWASQNGHIDVVKLLIKYGASIGATSEDGATPLHLASWNGHIDVVKLLIDKGAIVTVIDQHGWAPLHLASQNGHTYVMGLLIEYGAGIAVITQDGATPMHPASWNGHINAAKLLMEKGASVTAVDQHGWAPLHLASRNGHVDLVKFLIEHGAGIAVITEDGATPLHLAAENGHINVVDLLIDEGASTIARAQDGRTPLHLASRNGHVDSAKLLIKGCAGVAVIDQHGATPLHLASKNGHIDVAKLLVVHGANIEATTED